MQHPGKEFYENWAKQKIRDDLRNSTLKWKAVNLANLYLRTLKNQPLDSVCEIGGGEGTVLHTIGGILNIKQMVNFELSSEFCSFGAALYPDIQFINSEFSASQHKSRFDLIVLSDIIEHVEDDADFLKQVHSACTYALMKIPIEECLTSQDWYYRLRGKEKPASLRYGPNHENGHLRGYTVSQALARANTYFATLDHEVCDVTHYAMSRKRSAMKRWLGSKPMVWLFGGALFLLGKSRSQ